LAPTECKETSIVLGTDDAGRTVCLNPEELQTPHAIVIGKTGAGKTTLGINIAVQLRRKRGVVPAVIDPHGHWAMLAKWLSDVQIVDARQYMPPLRLTDEDDVDLLLDILRAAGIQIFDAHFTVLLEALRRAAQEKDTSYRNILKHLETLRKDPAFAFVIDSILGRLATLAQMRVAKVDLTKPLVVHTSGDTSPSSTMKLVTWIIWLVTEAKATCLNPPCKMRLFLVVDEGHILLKNTLVLSRTWREHRKFGVEAAVFTQSIAEIPQDLIENSGVKVVLAIEPEAVPYIEQRLHIDRTVVERVAYESLPEERVGIIRVEGRAPIYVRLIPPEHR
jgi:DNA helicase HerA-like ATPase